MRICDRCLKDMPLSDFRENIRSKDGFNIRCSSCKDKSPTGYGRTKKGLIHKIYSTQKTRSEWKWKIEISYSREELYEWMMDNHVFHRLYDEWVSSDFKIDLIPSIDRINDHNKYTLNNIQVTTWKYNRDKTSNGLSIRKLDENRKNETSNKFKDYFYN